MISVNGDGPCQKRCVCSVEAEAICCMLLQNVLASMQFFILGCRVAANSRSSHCSVLLGLAAWSHVMQDCYVLYEVLSALCCKLQPCFEGGMGVPGHRTAHVPSLMSVCVGGFTVARAGVRLVLRGIMIKCLKYFSVFCWLTDHLSADRCYAVGVS